MYVDPKITGSFDRRSLIAGLGLLPSACKPRPPRSQIVGADHQLGHRLRGGDFPPAEPGSKVGTLILGAGVSGLSAAYTLAKAGQSDFHILDLAEEPGGNARAGKNGELKFPWGAHYLPQPDRENEDLIAFLQDAGVITAFSAGGEAVYNDEYLCHDIEERLFYQGAWHEGLIPWKSLSPEELKDMNSFLAFIEVMRKTLGRDKRRAFRIPLDLSSRDAKLLELDRMSFANFIRGQGWKSPFIAWYMNYCCRDDYGTDWEETSAWAGLHYFAARSGKSDKVLTWPEGNNWLVQKLMKGFELKFTGEELIHKITPPSGPNNEWEVESYNQKLGINRLWRAANIVLALPRFVAARLLPDLTYSRELTSYAPWMVANCEVSAFPEGEGTPLAWDNVPYESASLGYVVSNHQTIERYAKPGVLTSYWPMSGGSSDYLRAIAGMRSAADWARMVEADMESMHPGFAKNIQKISIWLWGHGMIQPKPDYLWSEYRRDLTASPYPRLALAHSDMSGISIFEEAFARGIAAGNQVLGVTPWT